uniref:Uncharacterized protein n=1 Tax=Glossina pallidipes TaxID=7398 RepID=A0A1B0AK42_GLOPL
MNDLTQLYLNYVDEFPKCLLLSIEMKWFCVASASASASAIVSKSRLLLKTLQNNANKKVFKVKRIEQCVYLICNGFLMQILFLMVSVEVTKDDPFIIVENNMK